MKVSIITVTYNAEKFLEHCIQSICRQEYPDIEYIIIDGASGDRTCDIIKSYEANLSWFISEPDKGLYDAMNKGIKMASGDIIGILNSDDLYEDDQVVKDVVAAFKSEQKPDIVYGNLVYVKADDTGKVVRNWKSSAYYDSYFEEGHVPPHPSLFVKASVYKEAGFFNLSYRLAADYEFMLRVFKKHRFKAVYLDRLMVRMRLGGATNKSIKNIINGNKEILNAWKDNGLDSPGSLMLRRLIKRLKQFM